MKDWRRRQSDWIQAESETEAVNAEIEFVQNRFEELQAAEVEEAKADAELLRQERQRQQQKLTGLRLRAWVLAAASNLRGPPGPVLSVSLTSRFSDSAARLTPC